MTRANGHFPVFYSVAQHSLALCCNGAGRRAQQQGGSGVSADSDASEAYLSDITRPVKGCLPEYRRD